MIIKVKPIHRYEVTVKLENGEVNTVASNLTDKQAKDVSHAQKARADLSGIHCELIDESEGE